MATSVINLALGLYQWKDSYAAANQLDNMYNSIKWPLDYFLKCWRNDSQIYYAQVNIQTSTSVSCKNMFFLSLKAYRCVLCFIDWE